MLNKIIGLILIATVIVVAQDSVYRPGQVFTVNSAAPPANCTVGSVYIRTNPPASISVCSITNIWDDLATNYTSGSFTPTISCAGGTVPTFTTASGTYTRIGRLIFFNVYLNNTTGGTPGAGTESILLNLPFSTSSAQLPVRVQAGSSLNNASEANLFFQFSASSSTAMIYKMANVGSIIPMQCADLNHTNIRQVTLWGKILV